MGNKNSIKALIGAESLLLIFRKDVSNKLDIANRDWLEFEVKDKQVVIKKIEIGDNSIKTGDTNNQVLQSHNYEKNISAEAVSRGNTHIV
jgi:hypothetical protein